MNNLEKKVAEATLEKVTDEIYLYANKDELAMQVIKRANSDTEFLNFIKLTMQAIGLMEILEEDKKK